MVWIQMLSVFFIVSFLSLSNAKSTQFQKRKPSSEYNFSDYFYTAPQLDITVQKKRIKKYLNQIEGVCKIQSFDKKITQINANLKSIRDIVSNLSNQSNKLKIVDALFIGEIEMGLNIHNVFYGNKVLTKKLIKQFHFADSFLFHYFVMHNLPEDTANQIEQISPWARKTFKGLSCLYGNNQS